MIKTLRLLALAAALVLAGCSESDGDARAAIADSSESSADPTEAAEGDDEDASGSGADLDGAQETTSSAPATTTSSAEDSSGEDTSAEDTAAEDTAAEDSSAEDTGSDTSENEPGQDEICAALAELDDAGEKLSAVSDDDRDGLEQGFADFAAALERVDGASADFPELSPYSKTLVSATAEVIVILEKVDYDGVAAATDPAFEAAASDPAASEAGDRIAEFSKDRCGVDL